ncbi:MAG: acetate--CoA ligase family protein [Acidimicrobiales bacterium]
MTPRLDVTGRPVALRDLDLDGFFHPRSVMVLGASDTAGKPTAAMTRKLRAWAEEHGATFHPVNPNRDTVDGLACARRVGDIDGDVDLAVILTGDAVAGFETVLEKKPRFAVIFAAGFAEVGAEGELRQDELAEIVHASDTRLLGPNTNLNAFEAFRTDLPGKHLALITQSGHQGRPVFQAQELGIAMSAWAPVGNEVDLEFADFTAYFADQDDVGVVTAYIEGFKDGRTLMLAADRAASNGVPMVVVKVGRTEEGQSMAKSHTGHLTGSDAVTSAVFRQMGVTRVRGLDELVDTAALLGRAAKPNGDGVCVYAISGGTGAHMADMAAEVGLRLPELTAETQEALHEWIPTYLRVSNPVDNGGAPSSDWRGRKILDAIVADPNVDLVICPITGALASMSVPLTRDLVDVAETTDKPICVIWGSPTADNEEGYKNLIASARVTTFRTFGNCVGAVKAYFDHHAFSDRYESAFTRPVLKALPAKAVAAPLLVPRGASLSEHDSKQLLAAYGIPVTREQVCSSAAAAVKAAKGIGYPVVVKASSAAIAHKSDLGLVRVGLVDAKSVRAAYDDIAPRSDGDVLVSELVSGGTECVVGVSHDDLFGPVVLFGMGGVFVEVYGDVTFRVPPFTKAEARRMVDEVVGSVMLKGVRGRAKGDIGALVGVLMKVQRLAVDNADRLAELDINPLVVLSKGVVALDALAVTW